MSLMGTTTIPFDRTIAMLSNIKEFKRLSLADLEAIAHMSVTGIAMRRVKRLLGIMLTQTASFLLHKVRCV
jgi:hypothetical protein